MKSALGVLGVPSEALAAIEGVAQIAGLGPSQRKTLIAIADQGAQKLEDYAAGEYRDVGDADKDSLHTLLADVLAAQPTSSHQQNILVAALQSSEEVKLLVLRDRQVQDFLAPWGASDNPRKYFEGLAVQVGVLLREWAYSEQMRSLTAIHGVATTLQVAYQVLTELNAHTRQIAGLADSIDRLRSLVEGVAGVGSVSKQPIVSGLKGVPDVPDALQSRIAIREDIDRVWAQQAGDTTGGGRGTVILAGDGGVGKSQLAGSYFRHSGSHVRVWVTATSLDELLLGYAAGASAASNAGERVVVVGDPEKDAAAFLEWLAGRASDESWLVVLDDLAIPAPQMARWWPPVSAVADGPVSRWALVTTRNRLAYAGGNRRVIDVDVYTESEALGYLTERLGGRVGARSGLPLDALDEAADLAEDLVRSPVALSQATAVMIRKRIPCRAFRLLLRETDRRLSDVLPGWSVEDERVRAVTVTWSISVERANGEEPRNLAGPCAEIASVLDPTGAPLAVWQSDAALDYLTRRRHALATNLADKYSSGGDIAGSGRVTAEDARDALLLLDQYGIATCQIASSPTTVGVHALAQRAIREAEGAAWLGEASRATAESLLSLWPEIERDAVLATVLRRNASAVEERLDFGIHSLHFRHGRSLGEAGLLDMAVAYWAVIAGRARIALGPDHPVTLTARSNLARWRGGAGEPAKAVGEMEAVLLDLHRVVGPASNPASLPISNNLAGMRGEAGDAQGAVAGYRDLLPDSVRILGEHHPQTLLLRNNLASWRGRAGDAAGAVADLEELLRDELQVLGYDHGLTIKTRANLAFMRGQVGDVGGAVAEFEEVVRDRERVLGNHHPETLTARGNLASLRGRAGDAQGAVAAFQELLPEMMRVLGRDNPATLTTRGHLLTVTANADD